MEYIFPKIVTTRKKVRGRYGPFHYLCLDNCSLEFLLGCGCIIIPKANEIQVLISPLSKA